MWQQWLNESAAGVVTVAGERRVRVDTMLSRMKATSEPRLEDVLDEALAARQESGSDPVELRGMGPEWRAASVEQVRVSPDVRETPLTE
ncbi:hypothetical protein BRD03_08215 [Halobacteriales archaeon QS_9_68_17]|nr:MAG: hypothetical protein BRD03_08215 [Halobacteriales archaeon QS_9_68_17]